jgi:hypothetical protein
MATTEKNKLPMKSITMNDQYIKKEKDPNLLSVTNKPRIHSWSLCNDYMNTYNPNDNETFLDYVLSATDRRESWKHSRQTKYSFAGQSSIELRHIENKGKRTYFYY